MAEQGTEPVVICGGGIIGIATSYYLAKRGVKSIILEATGLAKGASGRAGGFLARDWCVGSPVHTLAEQGFDMHMELAKEFPNCDYRRLETLAVTAKQGCRKVVRGKSPGWLQQNVQQVSVMGTPENTAQVNPWKLCQALFKKAAELAGTEVRTAEVTGFQIEDGQVTGVKTKVGEVIQGRRVLIALGPWCSRPLVRSLNLPMFRAHKASSIVIDTPDTTPQALFMAFAVPHKDDIETEWIPRPDGTLYVCGSDSQEPLPDSVDQVTPSEKSIRGLKSAVDDICPGLSKTTKIEQSCYLPTTEDGIPVLGKVPGVGGLFIAAGHAVWGILCAPSTATAMADLILDDKCARVDLEEFSAARRWLSSDDTN